MKRTVLTVALALLSAFAFSQELLIVVAPFEVRAGSGFSQDDVEAIGVTAKAPDAEFK